MLIVGLLGLAAAGVYGAYEDDLPWWGKLGLGGVALFAAYLTLGGYAFRD